LKIHDVKSGRLTHEATQRRPSHRRNPRGGRGWPHQRWWLPPRRWASNGRGGGGVLILHSGSGLLCGQTLQQAVLPPSQKDHFAALRHPRRCEAVRWAQLACCGSARNPGALLRVGAYTNCPTRTSNQKSQVLWPKIPGEVAQKTRLCGSISQVEDLHSPEKKNLKLMRNTSLPGINGHRCGSESQVQPGIEWTSVRSQASTLHR